MRNLKRRFERFTAIALAVLMVVTTVDLSTFAVSAAGEGSGTYCEHHTEHTPECGYTEGIEGSPCTHEHGEECYSEVTTCVHRHDENCGYVEGVEDSCTHICSLENGCIISALNCTHEHDEACGYQAAVEGTPCIYECEECANVGSDTVSGNEVSEETTECTCETDDPAFHATNCPAYIAPENPQCYCAEKCTEDTLNIWCDVCGVQGVSACQGEDTAMTMADSVSYIERTWDGTKVVNTTKTITEYTSITSSTTSMSEGWYVLDTDVKISDRINVSGDVHLVLKDGYTLTVPKGINTGAGKFYVHGQENDTGKIVAITTNSTNNNAMIGGDYQSGNPVNIEIDGGSFEITWGSGAGIGDANNGAGGTIVINGGNIVLKGATYYCGGAGIGGNSKNSATTVTVNGGRIQTDGGIESKSALIGAGYSSKVEGNTVTINGGEINVSNTGKGAAIGAGQYGSSSININAGMITAQGYLGAGIGKGSETGYSYPCPINISGGTINATSDNGAGIGGGSDSANDTINISGGMINATSRRGAGIGGGSSADNGTIIISGGTINANSTDGTAIGGGYQCAGYGKKIVDSQGNEVCLYEIELSDLEEDVVVNSITYDTSSYGCTDVWTRDGKLYCYLLKTLDTSKVEINVGGVIYSFLKYDEENSIYLYTGHTHEWIFSLGKTDESSDVYDKIVAECRVAGCAKTEATFSIPENRVYTGSPIELVVVSEIPEEEIAITYTAMEGSLTDGKPVNAGTYKAVASLTDAEGQTVSTSDFIYEIKKQQYTDISAVCERVDSAAKVNEACTSIDETEYYSGTIEWSVAPVNNELDPSQDYTATITLNAKLNYKFGNVSYDGWTVESNDGVIVVLKKIYYAFDFEVSAAGNESVVLGTDYVYDRNTKTLNIVTNKPMIIKNVNLSEETDNHIVVGTGSNANITLAGVNIKGEQPILVKDDSGNVTITLKDETTNTLVATKGAGLEKQGQNSTLILQCEHASDNNHMCGENCGTLVATGAKFGAGIGGCGREYTTLESAIQDKAIAYNITIKGGNITAIGGENGAGIGSGGGNQAIREFNIRGYNAKNIIIQGGIIEARGGCYGAGIGSGGLRIYNYEIPVDLENKRCEDIKITDAVVTAIGGDGGAGIGSGRVWHGSGETNGFTNAVTGIIVEDCSLKVSAGSNAHAIGDGSSEHSSNFDATYATIPTNKGGSEVYPYCIANPDDKAVYIDGNAYVINNHAAVDGNDTNLYVYLTANTWNVPHTIKVGSDGTEEKYYYRTSALEKLPIGMYKVPDNPATPTISGSSEYGAKQLSGYHLDGWTWITASKYPQIDGTDNMAYYNADYNTYDYSGITGYNSSTNRVERHIPITITQKPITITADNKTIVYGDEEVALTYTISDGTPLVGEDTLSGSITRVAGSDAGTYAITQGTLANANYAITFHNGTYTITKANAKLNFAEDTKTLGYDGAVVTSNELSDVAVTNENDKVINATVKYGYRVNGSTGVFTSGLPTNVGTYEVKAEIEGTTNYNAASDTMVLTIEKRELADCDISDIEAVTYDGTAHKPAVTVKIGNVTLNAEDYTIDYSDNINAGTATITITGKNNCTGSVTKTFVINPKTVTPTIEISDESYDYTAEAVEPEVTLKDGTTVILASEYEVAYTGNTNAGTATITVTDLEGGNYTFEAVSKEFAINKATPTAEMFTYTAPTNLDFDGQVKEATVTTDKVGMGEITVRYSANPVTAGTYTVFIDVAESDNYNAVTDLVVGEFTIEKANSVISAAPTPIADLVYGGTALNLINAGTATGGEMRYSLDGTNYSSAIPTGTDAKTYTVWYKVDGDENHNDTTPASIEVTIAKGTPDIGTVSASNMENTLDVSQVVLSRSNETVPGTLSLAEGTTLQYGIHDYTYVFTPNDNTNYETVTGTVSITITDTNAPTATYKVGTDGWKQFINTITFGHFCKDYTTVDITYSDEGSGVADKQYYISDVEITNTENIQWSEYTDTLNINATGKYYIYVRVTDNYGNVVIQNSEGIVVYAESVITPTSFSCEYGEENDLSINISANGNTFANLTDGSGNEIATENYSIAGSTLTINGDYLSDLGVGEYTYKICMNPQGVENTEATLAYSFVVKVRAKELTVTGATATSRDYIANDKTVDITGITLSGKQGTDDVSVEITGLKGTLSSANAGTYTSVTLPTLTLTGDDAENYVLVQPTSAVATNVTINKLNPTITVGETEYYKTFGDADFTLDITDDNPEANVTYSSNDENVVTVSNGTVTIKGVGSATITVSMGASTNYNAAVDKTITVNVVKATYSVDTINKNYLYTRINADSINLAELLPEDCGTVYYASVTYNGALTFTSEDTKPKVTNGILAYTLESGAADDTGNIVVVVETQNYEDITITVNVTLIDKIPVNVDGEVELNSNILTYGETLSGLTFKSVDFVDNAGNEVAGTLAWKEPSATPNAGITSATWVFTPNNAEYASVEGTVAITVNKATPNVTGVPTVADRVYNPSVVLADSDLTGGTVKGVDGNGLAGGWSWQSTNVVPVVNNSGYIAVFTPTDSTNYETVTRTITVNVTKATPYVATKPTASALTYGQTLNQSVLSNGVIHYSETDSTVVAGSFAWETGTVKPAVSDSATTLYNVLFTPDDSDNYKEVTVKLTVSVSKAEATALNNANKTYVYAESKNGESVSIEGLPEDCGSVSYEISSISDTNNMLENVSVDATGKLTYDVKSLNAYSNGLSATVTVTVSMQNYEDLTYTLTVVRTDKLVQNISAENISLTFGDNDTDIVVTGNKTELSYRVVDDSNENGDVVTVDSTGKVHIVNSGTATVEIKAEGSSSYAEAICEIQVTVAKRTVNVPAKDDTVYTYTGLPQTYSIASSPFYTIENTTQTNAGTYDVAVSLISDNYQWSAVLPEYKFVIKPAQVTITAESHTVKQGDELPAFTYITTGLVNGENLPITVSVTCSATNSETVGTYDIVVSGPASEGNYAYSYTKGVLEVLAEDEAPFIMGDDGKMGWDAISDEIADAETGDEVVIDMNGATVVPGNIIEEARDKGITISFVLDNGLTWTIDGSTVTDGEIGNINFDTVIEDENNPLNNIPVEVINNITGEKATIEVSLAYSGEFGFTAVLTANLGSENAGYYANLFYYNPTSGKLEFMCADVIAANGEAKLTFTHASDYVVVIDDEDLGKKTPDDDDDDDDNGGGNNNNNNTSDTGNTKKEDEKDEVPDTGDAGTLYLWIMMVCAALGMAGVACYERLQKRNKK